jgi:hypothetical protein
MNLIALENALQSIIKPHLGAVSIFAPTNQNMPEQTLLYATYDLLTINHIGRVQRDVIDEDGDRKFYEHYEVVFRIIAYGQNAIVTLQNLSLALSKETVTNALAEANLSYSTKTAVRRLPEVISSRWEERAQINVTFFTLDEGTENIGFVDNATITGDYDDGDHIIVSEINR